jgi:hypothetical protein
MEFVYKLMVFYRLACRPTLMDTTRCHAQQASCTTLLFHVGSYTLVQGCNVLASSIPFTWAVASEDGRPLAYGLVLG